MGLDVYLQYMNPEDGVVDDVYEVKSEKYPNHTFTLSYFRSSYNSAGYNHFTRTRYGVNGLYYIFGVPDSPTDDYIRPNWQESLKRAEELLAKLINDPLNSYIIETPFGSNDQTKEEALNAFKKNLFNSVARIKEFGYDQDFTDHTGNYYLSNPLKVVALLPYKDENKDYFLLISKPKESNASYYIQATEIVIEAIKRVLGEKDPENYCLTWSY